MKKSISDLVAERLRIRRKELGISRREVGERSHVSDRYIAQLETGKANVSVVLLERIADALRVTLVSLVEQPNGKETSM